MTLQKNLLWLPLTLFWFHWRKILPLQNKVTRSCLNFCHIYFFCKLKHYTYELVIENKRGFTRQHTLLFAKKIGLTFITCQCYLYMASFTLQSPTQILQIRSFFRCGQAHRKWPADFFPADFNLLKLISVFCWRKVKKEAAVMTEFGRYVCVL